MGNEQGSLRRVGGLYVSVHSSFGTVNLSSLRKRPGPNGAWMYRERSLYRLQELQRMQELQEGRRHLRNVQAARSVVATIPLTVTRRRA
jgi:hypothetical protein